MSGNALVTAIELKSQVGPSFGNNFNNRCEEAIGSATDLWVAYREGRLGTAPAPLLGYFFLLEDCEKANNPIKNTEPHFKVDPAFKGALSNGVSYATRYEILCRRLFLERLYGAACLVLATSCSPSITRQPADDLSFHRFVGALRGHATTFLSVAP